MSATAGQLRNVSRLLLGYARAGRLSGPEYQRDVRRYAAQLVRLARERERWAR